MATRATSDRIDRQQTGAEVVDFVQHDGCAAAHTPNALMRALLLVAALAAGDDRHRRNHSRGNWTRAELSVAFTTDLHGEIGALKHAFWLAHGLPAPALLRELDESNRFVQQSAESTSI